MPKRKVGSTVTFKNGAKAKVLPSGRLRIFSGPTKKNRTKKGGSVRGAMRVAVRVAMRKKKGGSVAIP